jgi:virulence-associated protein VagC
MWTATVRESGDGQVIRLPGEIRFEAHEVLINKVDDMVVLSPRKQGWDLLAKSLKRFTRDYMRQRRQPRDTDRRP